MLQQGAWAQGSCHSIVAVAPRLLHCAGIPGDPHSFSLLTRLCCRAMQAGPDSGAAFGRAGVMQQALVLELNTWPFSVAEVLVVGAWTVHPQGVVQAAFLGK